MSSDSDSDKDRSNSNSPTLRESVNSAKSPRENKSRSETPLSQNSSGSRNKGKINSANSSRSQSPASERANSRSPNRSDSQASNRSDSANSHASDSSRSRSVSPASHRSKTSRKSTSQSPHKSDSDASEKSDRSHTSNKSRHSSKSGSESSAGENRRSRSHSKDSNRSQHGSSPNAQNTNNDNEKKLEKDRFEEPYARKKLRIIDTDSEEEEEREVPKETAAEGPDAAALFGDADDITSEEEEERGQEDGANEITDQRAAARGNSDDENDKPQDYEETDHFIEDGAEKDIEAPEVIPETRIDVEIPKIGCDLGKDIHFVKLPNFLSVDTRPFDHETYEDEIDEEETLDEEGRARLKLKVENTIRWREIVDKDGNLVKESNARLVRWSDGSLSLHLGSEIFDVYKQPLQGDHNHLFIRQGTGLQGQAVFRTKLSFRPHSTESFTHRKMTLSLADRSQKVSGIKILSQVGADPDHDRHVLLKKEEEKLRQSIRPTKARKRESGIRAHHHTRESYKEDEGSDEEGAISLNAIKNKYKSGSALSQIKGGAIYSSDEEGSDFETRRARKQDKPKALKDSESSESD